MDTMDIVRELLSSPGVQIPIAILFYLFLMVTLLRTEAGRRAFRAISQALRQGFFVFEVSDDRAESNRRRLSKLDERIAELSQLLTDKAMGNQAEIADREVELYLSQNLPRLIERKLNELRQMDAPVQEAIGETIKKEVSAFLQKVPIGDIAQESARVRREELKREKSMLLERTIEEQMRSAGRLKTVMINLFVMFNIGVLLIYLFAGATLTDKAVAGIIGLYISLAAFIVYIYRTSNSRSSVLLALREDAKKFYDALDFLDRRGMDSSLAESDVEVLRLFLVNRAEREKAAEHPYELILKGISNSNIQFKGGRIALGEGAAPNK